MPPKRRKFESTFPAARIKKIMQLDDDVGRVASSVPVVISRAVEIFLHSLVSRAAEYAFSRNAKTLTVSHLKHCIQCEKQWDFLKELTSKIADLSAEQEEAEEKYVPKRGRKRRTSPSQKKTPGAKKKQKQTQSKQRKEEESSESEEDTPEPTPAAQLLTTQSSSQERPKVKTPYVPPLILRAPPRQTSEPSGQANQSKTSLHPPASEVGGSISSLTMGLKKIGSQGNDSDDNYD